MNKKSIASAIVLSGAMVAGSVQAECTGGISELKQGRHSQESSLYDVVLWPPNHKLQQVTIYADSDTEGNTCDVEIQNVMQDEALDMPGSGNTTGFDAANCSNDSNVSSVDLRAERSGQGDGRFYEINYTMQEYDESGMAVGAAQQGQEIAVVPHDQGIKKVDTWVNGDMKFDSMAGCMPGSDMSSTGSMSALGM